MNAPALFPNPPAPATPASAPRGAQIVARGSRVALRRLLGEDLVPVLDGYSHPAIAPYLGRDPDASATENRAMLIGDFARAVKNPFAFAIRDAMDDETIGTVGFSSWDPRARVGEMSTTLLKPELLGKGLGKDAVNTFLRHVFSGELVRKVWLTVGADNQRAVQCYRRCGFREAGRLEGHRLHPDGSAEDVLLMEISRERFLGAAGISRGKFFRLMEILRGTFFRS